VHAGATGNNGAAVTIAAHILAARATAAESGIKLEVAQIFISSPRAREFVMTKDESAELKKVIAAEKIRVIAHGSYLDSLLAGPRALEFIRKEAECCEAAGITGLVLHLPNVPPEKFIKSLAHAYAKRAPGVRIYLETPTTTATTASPLTGSHYETPAKLAKLCALVRQYCDPHMERTGICIDTAHLWVNGVDISSYKKAAAWLAELESLEHIIPMACVALHLNDSVRELGTGPDMHAGLGLGKIWGGAANNNDGVVNIAERFGGLAAFVEFAQRHGTPVILERRPVELLPQDYQILHALRAQQ
jgi:endonuclease IV